jgi:hypothetical protein
MLECYELVHGHPCHAHADGGQNRRVILVLGTSHDDVAFVSAYTLLSPTGTACVSGQSAGKQMRDSQRADHVADSALQADA